MRNIVWMGMLAVMAIGGSMSAQTVYEFQCRQGDQLLVRGQASGIEFDSCGPASIFVRASCGSVTVESGCDADCSEGGYCGFRVTGDEAVSMDDEHGSCTIWGSGWYTDGGCRSITPKEAAEPEASGQGIAIKIPE